MDQQGYCDVQTILPLPDKFRPTKTHAELLKSLTVLVSSMILVPPSYYSPVTTGLIPSQSVLVGLDIVFLISSITSVFQQGFLPTRLQQVQARKACYPTQDQYSVLYA